MLGWHREKKEKPLKEKPLFDEGVKYIGGHPMFPHEFDTIAAFYEDRVEIGGGLPIRYEQITKLGAQQDRHITKTRVFVTGPVGLFWRKIYRYTVIAYHDGIMPQEIVLDFHRHAERIHQFIYGKMVEAKQQPQAQQQQQQ